MLEKKHGHFILFKEAQNYKTGTSLDIYLKITVDGKPKEFSTGRKVLPKLWNLKACKAIGW